MLLPAGAIHSLSKAHVFMTSEVTTLRLKKMMLASKWHMKKIFRRFLKPVEHFFVSETGEVEAMSAMRVHCKWHWKGSAAGLYY